MCRSQGGIQDIIYIILMLMANDLSCGDQVPWTGTVSRTLLKPNKAGVHCQDPPEQREECFFHSRIGKESHQFDLGCSCIVKSKQPFHVNKTFIGGPEMKLGKENCLKKRRLPSFPGPSGKVESKDLSVFDATPSPRSKKHLPWGRIIPECPALNPNIPAFGLGLR